MSEQEAPKEPQLAANPLGETEESKELTDKIHRLVRYFSRQLVDLVYQEIGARKIVLKGKPGPKPGFKMPLGLCPVCRITENSRRRFGFICKDCSAGKCIKQRTKMREIFKEHRPAKQKKRDKLGRDYKIKVKIPKHLPVKPEEVPIESLPDVEPDFVDTLVEFVEAPPPPAPPVKQSDAPSSDDGEMDWFS